MRQHHYQFAHRVLRDAVLDDPAGARKELSGSRAAKWLRSLWDKAGEETGSDELPSLLRVSVASIHGYDAYVVTLPPALHVTEAWGALIAFPKAEGGEACYFLLERGADADDTGHWARYRPGGMRIRGGYVPGTDPALLVFAFKVEMDVPPEWKVQQDREFAEAAKRKVDKRTPRTVPPKFDIPGWWDKELLARIVQEYRSVTFLVVLTLFAVGGAIVPTALGAIEIGVPMQACAESYRDGVSPYKHCMRNTYRGPAYDKKAARKRCKRATKGKDLIEYCLDRHSGGLQWVFVAAGALGLALFFFLLTLFYRWRTPAFVKILRDRPEDVVWVYLYTVRRRGGGTVFEQVYLGMKNGSKHTIDVVGPSEQVLRAVASLTTSATLGYTEALQKQFLRDPKSLRR